MLDSLLADGDYGSFINGWGLIPIVLISLGWLKLMTWADKDSSDARMPREVVNGINLGGWVIGLLLMLVMPNVWAALGVFVLLLLAEAGYYLGWRNSTVGLTDLSGKFKAWLNGMFKRGPKEVVASESEVVLIAKNGESMQPPTEEDPNKPAYDGLQSLLQAPLKLGAQKLELRPIEGGAVQRYTVDGMTFEGKPFSKEVAASSIELAKQLAGMDVNDRRKPQNGKLKVTTEKGKHELGLYTAGSTAGELLKVEVDHKKQYEQTVDTVGLLQDQHNQLMEAIQDPPGVVLVTAPEGHGLTNLCYAIIRRHDAFLTQILTLERNPQADLEGIRTTVLAPNAPAGEEQKQIEWMISQEPDVIYLDRCDDPRSAILLAKYAEDGKRVYVGMRAPSAFEAMAQWRKLIGDDQTAMASLRLIIGERLIRVLCNACKIAYSPDPDALKKMNMNPDRVSKLYQARKEPMRDQKGNEIICPFCHGLAYQGRTGVFEFFRVDEEVRNVILAGGTINQLKALFRKQKQRYLQESALARVEMGDTSVEEVLRVLRGSSSSSKSQAQ